jgi:hypothetical protein
VSRYRTGNSGIHGIGIFATRRIMRGQIVGHLLGKCTRRPRKNRNGDIYAIEMDNGSFLVPSRPSPLWRLNHSCSANAGVQTAAGSARVVALKTIRAGEEITCDYRPSLHNGQKQCNCGSAECSGKF